MGQIPVRSDAFPAGIRLLDTGAFFCLCLSAIANCRLPIATRPSPFHKNTIDKTRTFV